MRREIVLCVLVMAVGAARGSQGAQNPAALTQDEIAAGWVALYDGHTSFGWGSRGDARWTMSGGALAVEQGGVGALATSTVFGNFVLRAEFWADKDANGGIAVRAATAGPITDVNSYLVKISDAHEKWPTGSISGQVAGRTRRSTTERWTPIEIRCEGTQIRVAVDGRQASRLVNRALTKGAVALVYGGTGAMKFRNIRLQPLGSKPLFNGKDLTGWKIVSGTQAVCSVTREGWLNVRNGRGDLQTTDAFGDFILQMEVFVNGEHLNSGVFFRANPDGFWSGYEAQIRNQWQGDDRSSPVDFGSGGIYNRQPARKVVSNDREWFTLTILAHGLRIATWVNGYQVTDFLDTREADETNARRGARTSAGVFSIQGHDPTTDLSFRNIRVVEYAAPSVEPAR